LAIFIGIAFPWRKSWLEPKELMPTTSPLRLIKAPPLLNEFTLEVVLIQ
jgi:hypothetical protein